MMSEMGALMFIILVYFSVNEMELKWYLLSEFPS